MITAVALTVGLGLSSVQSTWGEVGEVTSLVPLVTTSLHYEEVELKLSYGFQGSEDSAFNGWYEEEASVSNVLDISLLKNFKVTPDIQAYIGYGYTSFTDHGNPKGYSGWKETDEDFGFRLGVKYNVTKDTYVDLGYSQLYKSSAHKERTGGSMDTQALGITFNYRF